MNAVFAMVFFLLCKISIGRGQTTMEKIPLGKSLFGKYVCCSSWKETKMLPWRLGHLPAPILGKIISAVSDTQKWDFNTCIWHVSTAESHESWLKKDFSFQAVVMLAPFSKRP